jgi:hypothetical protein
MNIELLASEPDFEPRMRRRLRIRNHLFRISYWGKAKRTAEVFGDIVVASLRKGAAAARQIVVPATVVQVLMILLALSYFYFPPSHAFFKEIIAVRVDLGLWFSFLSLGMIAVLAEYLQPRSSGGKSMPFAFAASYAFLVMGCLGIVTDFFYVFQNFIWKGLSPTDEIVAKVLTDQFIYTVLFANPYQTFLYVFKDCGFAPHGFVERVTPFKTFYVKEVLAVLITNWAFWIPTTAILYSLPLDLQFIISRLAITIWVLLLTTITKRN